MEEEEEEEEGETEEAYVAASGEQWQLVDVCVNNTC